MAGERQTIRKALFAAGMAMATVAVVGSLFRPRDIQVYSYDPRAGTGPRSAEQTGPLVSTEAASQVCELSQKYPESVLQWCALIAGYAHLRNFDPNFIAAVVLQESGGNHNIISHSGAVGLMQVMPRDGIAATFLNENNEPYFADRPAIAELTDPTFNVDYGTGYLEALRNQKASEYSPEELADPAVQREILREILKQYGPRDRGYEYADIVLAIYDRSR